MSLRKFNHNKGSADTQFIFGLVMLFLLLGFVYFKIMEYLNTVRPNYVSDMTARFVEWFEGLLPFIAIFSFTLSAIFMFLIVFVYRKYARLVAEETKKVSPSKKAKEETKMVNEKWERVQNHLVSENPSDWKLAILEADIMLDEMLDKMGYHGDTVGDKLKGVEKSDFTTIDLAWEAHKVRNSIAHEGSEFLVNKREADRVIALYQSVFEEFKYI